VNKLPMLSDAGADTGEDVVEALLRADVEECMELIAANPNSNAAGD
jgi:hypothetical protein